MATEAGDVELLENALHATALALEAERALADKLSEALDAAQRWLPAQAIGSPLDRLCDDALVAYRAARGEA